VPDAYSPEGLTMDWLPIGESKVASIVVLCVGVMAALFHPIKTAAWLLAYAIMLCGFVFAIWWFGSWGIAIFAVVAYGSIEILRRILDSRTQDPNSKG
jgi:hypothetical protein